MLMNRGRIVQNGNAETLYTQPVDLFAAGFIGNYNLLSAEQATQLTGQPFSSRWRFVRNPSSCAHRRQASRPPFSAIACSGT